MIIASLLAPDSDYGSWHWFCQRTALAEMLPVDLTAVGKDAFYEIADDLYLRKEQLEKGLVVLLFRASVILVTLLLAS